MGMGDLAGELELVPEALDRPQVGGDLGLEELERDILLDLPVEDLVDPAHPALADLLDDLVAVGESPAPLQAERGSLQGQSGTEGRLLAFLKKGEAALGAVVRLGGIIELATGAFHLDCGLDRLGFKDINSGGFSQIYIRPQGGP